MAQPEANNLKRGVWSVDVSRLSQLLDVAHPELIHFLSASDPALFPERSSLGTPTGDGRVAWHTGLGYAPQQHTTTCHVKTALVSTASRTSRIDTPDLPKELVDVGGHPILLQLLRQLADAGCERVVLLVAGAQGQRIADRVRASPLPRFMHFEFVDIGSAFKEGHAASLILAEPHVPPEEPFLVCTSDHCYESRLVRTLMETPMPGPWCHGQVLVEYDVDRTPAGLPPSAVYADVAPDGRIRRIARDLSKKLPLEAGLFVLDRRIFDALKGAREEALENTGLPNFTLAMALDRLAQEGALVARASHGGLWCAVETLEELRAAERAAAQTTMRVSTKRDEEGHRDPESSELVVPLMNSGAGNNLLQASDSTQSLFSVKLPDGIDAITFETVPRPEGPPEPWAEPPPKKAPESPSSTAPKKRRRQRATVDSPNLRLLLAETGPDQIGQSLSIEVPRLRRVLTGPAAVASKEEVAPLILKVSVEKSVPAIGWIVMTLALLGMSSTELGFRVLGQSLPLLTRLSWRFQAAALILLPVALVRLWASRKVRASLRSAENLLLVAAAALGWAFHFGTFVVALGFTSPALALVFNNMVPLLLLAVRLARRLPVTRSEAFGAVVGIIGTAILTLAPAPSPEEGAGRGEADPRLAHLGSAIAASGAFGGMVYMLACKHLRPVMEPSVQFFGICFMAAVYLAPVAAAMDPEGGAWGLLGWLRPDRMPICLGASLVCELIGNLGFVVALKYVSPLTVSVLVLMGPLVAAMESMALGEAPPAPVAWLGMGVTLTGTAVVVVGAAHTSTAVDVALH